MNQSMYDYSAKLSDEKRAEYILAIREMVIDGQVDLEDVKAHLQDFSSKAHRELRCLLELHLGAQHITQGLYSITIEPAHPAIVVVEPVQEVATVAVDESWKQEEQATMLLATAQEVVKIAKATHAQICKAFENMSVVPVRDILKRIGKEAYLYDVCTVLCVATGQHSMMYSRFEDGLERAHKSGKYASSYSFSQLMELSHVLSSQLKGN